MHKWMFGLFALFFLPSSALAQEKDQRILHVIGTAEVHIPASIAEVQVGVASEPFLSAREAQNAVAGVSGRLVALLRENGVENIQTRSLRLTPQVQANRELNTMETLYTAQNIVTFRTEPQKVGQLLDQTVDMGATRIDNVASFASSNERRAAKKQAIAEATAIALEDAEAVLLALNLSLKEIVKISIDHDAPFRPMVMMRMAADGRQNSAFEPGTDSVRATVHLDIAY